MIFDLFEEFISMFHKFVVKEILNSLIGCTNFKLRYYYIVPKFVIVTMFVVLHAYISIT